MNILNINSSDLMGWRFNGLYLRDFFISRSHKPEYYVWDKDSELDFVHELFNNPLKGFLKAGVDFLEKNLSLQSLFYPFPLQFFFDGRFQSADIVHYHLIHTGYFSLGALPALSMKKPSVWTIHDPWAMTGHCVYPYDCEKWRTGCGECPYPETHFAIKKDRTALNWKIKKFFYEKSNIHIVVASEWMKNMAESSPLMKNFKIHKIPFGLELDKFKPLDSAPLRRKLGIDESEIVIGFRATEHEFKGMKYLIEALKILDTDRKITLLPFGGFNAPEELRRKYKIIDDVKIQEEKEFIEAYNAADFFLMPSTAEAFGMMAMEALACGRPVICFEGTSLPEVIMAPEGGIAVKYKDSAALAEAVKKMAEDDEFRKSAGAKAREISEKHYDFNRYASDTLSLYEEVLKERLDYK